MGRRLTRKVLVLIKQGKGGRLPRAVDGLAYMLDSACYFAVKARYCFGLRGRLRSAVCAASGGEDCGCAEEGYGAGEDAAVYEGDSICCRWSAGKRGSKASFWRKRME